MTRSWYTLSLNISVGLHVHIMKSCGNYIINQGSISLSVWEKIFPLFAIGKFIHTHLVKYYPETSSLCDSWFLSMCAGPQYISQYSPLHSPCFLVKRNENNSGYMACCSCVWTYSWHYYLHCFALSSLTLHNLP